MPKRVLLCSLLATVMVVVGLAPSAWARSPVKPRPPDPIAILARQTLVALSFSRPLAVETAMTTHAVALFSASSEPGDEYVALREQLASLVADRLKTATALALVTAWADASEDRMVVVLSALSQLGVRYRWGTQLPGISFDCSGLTRWSWAQVGVELPRSARSQIRTATRRPKDALQVGDLVYHVEHVSLYLGAGNAVVNAPQTGKLVEVRDWRRETRFGDPLG